jgi:hypothetical protein
VIARDSPGFSHTEAGGDHERGIAILREVLQGPGESLSSAADHCFATTVDTFDGREIEFSEEVTALLKVTCEFGKQEVGCECKLDRLE